MSDTSKLLSELRREIVGGSLYSHSRSNANTSRLLEATACLCDLVELPAETGIISIEKLDARKAVVAERLEQRPIAVQWGGHVFVDSAGRG